MDGLNCNHNWYFSTDQDLWVCLRCGEVEEKELKIPKRPMNP